MFTAVSGFLIKLAIALVSIIAGYVLVLVGIDGANPIISVSDLNLVREMYVWIPTVSMLLTIVLIWKYPLSKEKVQEIQEKLRERAAAKAASGETNN
jgi:Na+/melibiose symporter-like transporter